MFSAPAGNTNQAIFTVPKYFLKNDLTEGFGVLKFAPTPPETTARPKGQLFIQLGIFAAESPATGREQRPAQPEACPGRVGQCETQVFRPMQALEPAVLPHASTQRCAATRCDARRGSGQWWGNPADAQQDRNSGIPNYQPSPPWPVTEARNTQHRRITGAPSCEGALESTGRNDDGPVQHRRTPE